MKTRLLQVVFEDTPFTVRPRVKHVSSQLRLLTFATTISGKGLNVDLNVAALAEEESSTAPATRLAFDLNVDLNVALAEEQLSTTPFHSATSQVAPTSIASREKPDLPRYQTKSFTPSSSGLRILSLGSTSANKRKGGEQLEQQVITKFFRGEEKDPDYSKQQAEGTEKDGKMISEISKFNPLQPEDVENLDNSSEVSNVIKDWNFVKVEGGAEILNWYIKPPGENHDEKDLFAFMEKLNHEKQDKSPGVFWIEREYADKFFKSYKDLAGSDLSAGNEAGDIIAEQQLIEDELQQFSRTHKSRSGSAYNLGSYRQSRRQERHDDLLCKSFTAGFMRQPKSYVKTTHSSTDPTSIMCSANENLDNSGAPVHNALLPLNATQEQDNEEDALRICKLNNELQSCGLIYCKVGLIYERSLDLALWTGDLELDINTAMEFLESIGLLKIEDILTSFPDFVVIDELKASICNALETYLRQMLTIQTKLALQAPMGAGGVGAARLMDKGGLMMNPGSLLLDWNKLALASVQGLDHVRRMIIPHALGGLIGDGVGVIGSDVGALGGVLPILKMTKLTRLCSTNTNTSASSPKADHLS
ncbi:hypothetical protein PCASD_03075 [Puccinia coronata f. sp. avenae]|uniref:Uncharacterized protein n=2 Tax=Puccinia coronata f. sp. avenae TaxID=200324 RepID=A0A2N5V5P7_9BASI|nr:hypothetical protein PCASD_03075 [Puccinia coronata f. sp. avenae]